MRSILLLALLATPALSTPIYQEGLHGSLPGREHYQIQHVRHVDEQGRVTYIHDTTDHRPDFCAMPGEEELCRQQIEAANNAPTVYDNDTIILNTPHDPNELNELNELAPGRAAAVQDPSTHAVDTTLTVDNGDVITIHNENGHVRNVNDGTIDLNAEGPAADGGHIPNINIHASSMHQEKIQSEDVPVDNIPHPRNINDGNSDGPAPDAGHVPNINEHGQSLHKEQIKQDMPPVDGNVSHPRNINDGNGDVPEGNLPHPRNINDGQSVKEKSQSSPIYKLQEIIYKLQYIINKQTSS